MIRLFIAIDLPQETQSRLSSLCHGSKNIKWVKPENMHLTLRFLGELDQFQYQQIAEALGEISQTPFIMEFNKLGFFGTTKHPKTLWAGVENSTELMALYEKIEQQLWEVAIEKEDRSFHPHVTLGRFKNARGGDLVQFFEHNSLPFIPPVTVNSFSLFSSKLTPAGPIYTLEEKFELI